MAYWDLDDNGNIIASHLLTVFETEPLQEEGWIALRIGFELPRTGASQLQFFQVKMDAGTTSRLIERLSKAGPSA